MGSVAGLNIKYITNEWDLAFRQYKTKWRILKTACVETVQNKFTSVASWPIVRPHNSKRPNKKIESPDKGVNERILADFVQKGPKMGRTS
jgi:hypothetical protein